MSHNYTKRIKNTITFNGENYALTTSKSFVPNKGSKVFFRQTDVNPIQCTVTFYGAPPAHKYLKSIYDKNMDAYYTTMKNYKKFRKKRNKSFRVAS